MLTKPFAFGSNLSKYEIGFFWNRAFGFWGNSCPSFR